jgi:hypothetical protein
MAAGTRRIETTFAAAGVVENILAGSPLEYPGVASSIEIAATAGNGLTPGDCTMDVIIGTDMVAEALVLGVEAVAQAGPKLPDDLVLQDAVAPADHVQIRLRRTAAGAATYTSLVRIQPV